MNFTVKLIITMIMKIRVVICLLNTSTGKYTYYLIGNAVKENNINFE